MPAFDPVRDAVLNSPVESRRPTSLSALLNPQTDFNYDSPRPSSSGSHPTASPMAAPSTIPYNPTKRVTKPESVLIPLTPAEIEHYKNFRGEGVARLTAKRKRAASDEPDPVDSRPSKRHTSDVGVVVEHCTISISVHPHLLTHGLQTILGQMLGWLNGLNHPLLASKTLITGSNPSSSPVLATPHLPKALSQVPPPRACASPEERFSIWDAAKGVT